MGRSSRRSEYRPHHICHTNGCAVISETMLPNIERQLHVLMLVSIMTVFYAKHIYKRVKSLHYSAMISL